MICKSMTKPKKSSRVRQRRVSAQKLEQAVQEVLEDRQDPDLDAAEVEMELARLLSEEGNG